MLSEKQTIVDCKEGGASLLGRVGVPVPQGDKEEPLRMVCREPEAAAAFAWLVSLSDAAPWSL